MLDGQDVLAILPTGGGKSICYQVPALAQDGICLVISPLIALMKDQIENLRSKGIMALGIYSGMSRRMMVQTLKNAMHGNYKFLYVSPERLETSLFLEYLPALGVSLVAVDEAHCVSQWGYDFRPSYLRIAAIREELKDVPFLALTASATQAVQKDICEKLHLHRPAVLQQSFVRPNLSYSVFQPDAKQAKLVDIMRKVAGSSIVYCKSRRRTAELAALLQLHGLSADFYHAGLRQAERDKRQQSWMENKTGTMVCTTAFGMGIDKPDVRLVVHVDLPDSLEGYYQEAGRAGRDGKKAYAVLLFTGNDVQELSQLHEQRYPSLEKIRAVYQALVNYLQMPVHTGEDQLFDFDLETFCKNFGIDTRDALYALKALESDGWLDFNEKSFAPSTVVFTTSRAELESFQRSCPHLEPLLLTLLRTYGGIFDFPVPVSEKLLGQLLRQPELEVKTGLNHLAGQRVIQYEPQSDTPKIIFRKNRVSATDLWIDLASYEKRKEAFKERVQGMLAYVTTAGCRSSFINRYFSGEETAPCGVCDNCLSQKNKTLNETEFNRIHAAVVSHLKEKPVTTPVLLEQLQGISRNNAWKVIDYLQAEKKIEADRQGRLHLK